MSQHSAATDTAVLDIDNCAQEPIHIPGMIQSHGVLLALSADDCSIRHVSCNAEALLGRAPQALIGRSVGELLAPDERDNLLRQLQVARPEDANPIKLTVQRQGNPVPYDAIVHRNEDLLILELEPTDRFQGDLSFSNLYRRIQQAIAAIERSDDALVLCQAAVSQVKQLTGFDRVMVYQFDADWNGRVVAEAKEPDQTAFLDLHFPASDIPAQARELYRRNPLRLIPDVHYQPVELYPKFRGENRPLDLSHSVLRSVSPMHVQYLKNMQVGASMSLSILCDGKLWGLIALHHTNPRYLPFELRQGLEFLGKLFSLQLMAHAKKENVEYKQRLKDMLARLRLAMAQEAEFLQGLARPELNLLHLFEGVTGALISYQGQLQRFGQTPTEEELQLLLAWLQAKPDLPAIYRSESLAAEFVGAEAFCETASGMLCLTIPEPGPNYILWFKPEVVRTVNWGGNPNKPVELGSGDRTLSPRRSFALWRETRRATALPWQPEELEAAEQLRQLIVEADLNHQLQLVRLSNEELDQFAHVVAHDLKEPLRGIGNLTGFLQKDLQAQLAAEDAENLREIADLAERGRRLVSELYEYSRLGQISFAFTQVDLNDVVVDVLARLNPLVREQNVEVEVKAPLPVLYCDRARVGEIFANLVANGIRYTERPPRTIEIGAFQQAGHWVCYVRDNGIGIAEADQARVFKLFERLHAGHEFGGGTGSGLAIVKRIVIRHGGRIWIESTPGHGSTFCFTLAPT